MTNAAEPADNPEDQRSAKMSCWPPRGGCRRRGRGGRKPLRPSRAVVVVHTYAGYENKVKSNLESRIASMNMEERIFEVVIPVEDVIEFKTARSRSSPRRSSRATCWCAWTSTTIPGTSYENTPGSPLRRAWCPPTPLTRREVDKHFCRSRRERRMAKKEPAPAEYEWVSRCGSKEGPFADSPVPSPRSTRQLQAQVLVNIFGRETPVELEFAQVAKL